MKFKNFEVVSTFFKRDGLSFHLVSDNNGKAFFLRALNGKANAGASTEKWYDLYEHYLMTVTNYKYLPRVHSIDRTNEDNVFTTFPFVPGQPIQGQGKNRLSRDEVEQLLDAISHLHVKGLVHGCIIPENIWLSEWGKIILFGAGENLALGQESKNTQDDLQQLIGVLANYSDIEPHQIQQLQKTTYNDIEEIRQQLLNPVNQVNPGLVEKEKKAAGVPGEPIQSTKRKPDVPIPTNIPSTQKNKTLKKQPFTKWILAGGAAAIILAAAVWGGIQIGGMKAANAVETPMVAQSVEAKPKKVTTNTSVQATKPAPSKVITPAKVNTTPFTQDAIDQLAPGWKLMMQSKIIHFPTHDIVVAGISDEDQGLGKGIVVQFDSTAGKWVTKWSGEILADNDDFPFYSFQSILVTQSTSKKTGLALIAADVGGSTGYGQALAVTIDESGNCNLEEKLNIDYMSIEQKDHNLLLSGGQEFGVHQLRLQGEQFIDTKTPASELSTPGAVKAAFQLWDDGGVLAVQDPDNIQPTLTLNMKVGQTIEFVPSDDSAKSEFDKGDIWIFTDGGSGTLDTSNASKIGSGNSYTFDTSGTVQFYLTTPEADSMGFNEPPITPTFVVNVESTE